ncbi:PAS domain S-box protein [Pelotomaculum isophthalicicum JI]|uniref:PAS domain S-box protein n=1 Tax=Pelotomaculum isophthalicicum JI TaxID=947010 RepID=A0A9X4H132_9FIRM|nr:PAS domain S-box protein [Pelotomaculum isophthalicicum]MDF9407806.1 PAS domain S-box protein [Pelotomaculum isophthalicicum JI]
MFFNPADIKKPLCHIKPHAHNCLIYKTPEEWRAAVIPFLSMGLFQGEKCLYITDDPSTAGQVRQYLLEEKVDVAAAERSGQLDFFIRESLNDPAAGIINLLINETKKAIAEGYPLLRVTGEMIIPKSRLGFENLLEQEARLNRDFFSEYPCVALCQYNRNKFAPEIIIEALKTHPFLVKGSRVHRNSYYVPPEEYLDPKRKDNEVDNLLESLEQGNNKQREITERKLVEEALRESEKKYRVLYEQANDAIFLIKKGIIIDCNPKALNVFGCRRDEIIGKNPFDYAPSTQPCGTKSRIKAIGKIKAVLRGKQQFFEFQHCRQDGATFMTEVSLSKFRINNERMLQAIIRDITARKHAEEALQESEKRYRQIVETAYEGIWVIDAAGKTTFANKRMAEMLGYTVEEMVGQPLSAFMYEEYRSIDSITDTSSMQKIKKVFYRQYDYQYRRKDGTELHVIMSVSPLFNNDESYAGALGMVTDITERKLAEVELKKSNTALATANEELIAINEELLSIEEELKQQFEKLQASERALASANQRLQDIIEFLPDATFVIDNDKKVIAWNRAIEKMTGAPKEEMLGNGDSAYAVSFYGKPRPILIDFAIKTHNGNTAVQYDSFKKEGHFVHGSAFVQRMYGGKGAYLWGIAAPLFDREGNLAGAIESIRDITEQRQLENRLKYLGMHDSLTGLHNRAYFEEEMRRLEDGRNISAGIIVCDVDGLKLVNDTLGHDTGDLLLIAAAGIIKDSFRESDMVARIGGDEFAVLLPNNEIKIMESACKRIQEGVIRHNAVKPELPLSISAGFAARNDGSISMSDLFREADNKMYRVKLHRNQSARSAIVQTLMKALEARDFITEEHAERIQGLVSGLAAAIDLSERSITDLRLLAQFHDIGKIGIPDSILLKPGSLTSEEFIEMQQHCEIGHRIAILSPDLFPIADWILKHHEWWNGHGYPLGLKGEEIPLECRILAIADAFDAMTSDRPYRKAMPHGEALAELKKCAGIQFDPYLVGKFIQLHNNNQ